MLFWFLLAWISWGLGGLPGGNTSLCRELEAGSTPCAVLAEIVFVSLFKPSKWNSCICLSVVIERGSFIVTEKIVCPSILGLWDLTAAQSSRWRGALLLAHPCCVYSCHLSAVTSVSPRCALVDGKGFSLNV